MVSGKYINGFLNNEGVAIIMDGKSKEKIYLASPHMSEEGFEQEYIEEAFVYELDCSTRV